MGLQSKHLNDVLGLRLLTFLQGNFWPPRESKLYTSEGRMCYVVGGDIFGGKTEPTGALLLLWIQGNLGDHFPINQLP